jgi:hypothetical protein
MTALQTGNEMKAPCCWEGKSRRLPVVSGFVLGHIVTSTVVECRSGTVNEKDRDCVCFVIGVDAMVHLE